MRTRQDREEEGAELAQLMGWGAGDARVGLSKMHDGALAFAAETAALDFADALEAEAARRPYGRLRGRRAGLPRALPPHGGVRRRCGPLWERDDGWVPAPEDVRAELR